ncbi:MAG TPA: hypothetical protein VMR37_02240 [Rhabdochlamydiaceae bacterium]|nr:hypothetical protein [Rhabdochlamydiaceae bacterium]
MKKIILCISLLTAIQAWPLSCTPPVTLIGPGQHASEFQIVMNEEGEARAFWISTDLDSEDDTVIASTMNAEKKWSSAAISEPLKEIELLESFIDAQGNSFAFWESGEEDSEGEEVRFYHFAKQEKDQVWSPAVNVSGPDNKLKYSSCFLDSQGNALLFGKIEIPGSQEKWKKTYSIVAMNYLHKNGEKKRTEISKVEHSGYIGYLASERLIRNKEGKTFACWEEFVFDNVPGGGYQCKKLLKGSWLQHDSSWSDPAIIYKTTDRTDFFMNIKPVMNSNGDVAIIWEKNNSETGPLKTIQALTCFNGQWSEPFSVADSPKYSDNVTIIMNDAGDIAASWKRSEKGKEVLYVADKPFGQPWSSPVALSGPGKDVEKVRMLMDAQGNITVVWISKAGKKYVAYVADKSTGKPWSAPLALPDPAQDIDNFKLSMDAKGNALVVWTVIEERIQVPYAMYKPVNQAWASPVRLTDGTNGCDDFKIKVNDIGYFVVLWHEKQNKQYSIHGAALSTATQEWSYAEISPQGQNCRNFTLQFNKKGQGIVGWRAEDDDDVVSVYVAELNVN